MWESLSMQVHSMASHYQLGDPIGECIFRLAVKGSHWLKVKLHKGHTTDSEVIQNGWIFSRQTTPTYTSMCVWGGYVNSIVVIGAEGEIVEPNSNSSQLCFVNFIPIEKHDPKLL